MHARDLPLAIMLLITMAVSTLSFFELIVVASEIQDDLGISKFQIGLLGAVNTGVGGLFGLKAGSLCDQFGGRSAIAAVLVISGVTSVMMALTTGYVGLLVGMGLAGFAQGLGNPATNKAISESVATDGRGVVTGIKQSGVQFAVFTTGFAMPAISAAWGWRAGMWIAAAIAFGALLGLPAVGTAKAPPADSPSSAASPSRLKSDPLLPFVYQVALYGFLLGSVGGGIGRFVPLFAEEVVGFTPSTAGVVFGLAGLIAVGSRVVSGVLLDRGLSARHTLMFAGVGGALSLVLMVLAGPGPAALLWAATILSGFTISTWNTAANLAMVRQGPSAGRASGLLVSGFMIGLTVSGPIVGWSIDELDSYTPAFIGSVVLAVAGAAAVAPRLSAEIPDASSPQPISL